MVSYHSFAIDRQSIAGHEMTTIGPPMIPLNGGLKRSNASTRGHSVPKSLTFRTSSMSLAQSHRAEIVTPDQGVVHELASSIGVSSITMESAQEYQSNDQDKTWQDLWQQNHLPTELAITQSSTPQEICNIITESLNQYRAIRDSIVEANSIPQLAAEALGLSKSVNDPQESEYSFRTASQLRTRSSSSAETTDSRSVSPVSSTYRSVESFTTAGSHSEWPLGDLPLSEPHYVPQRSENVSHRLFRALENTLQPGSPSSSESLAPQRGPERHPKRNGLMRLFRGKEQRTHSLKQGLSAMSPISPISPVMECGRSLNREASRVSLVAPSSPMKECASCFDDVSASNAVDLTCQHSYCPTCFSHLVTNAMQHENFWPPKCCLQEIPKKTLEIKLSAVELANYRLKAKEYSIPAGERWYCSRPECGKWFNKSTVRARDAMVSCSHCNYEMCLYCRGEVHPRGERCPQDRSLEATLAAAELEGWRRCFNCHTMVELTQGCRHITCTCGSQFCYTCGAKWRTCNCTERDQEARRQELATRRAIATQEEAEIRAAIEAVARAEREEREAEANRLREVGERMERERIERERQQIEEEEAREVEEMHRLVEMEAAREQTITSYFNQLRSAMSELHKVQSRALFKRQKEEMLRTRQELEMVVGKEAKLDEEKHLLTLETEELLNATRQKHARHIIEAFARHRNDQLSCIAQFNENSCAELTNDIMLAEKLDQLAIAQQSERDMLGLQHKRELRKLQARTAARLVEHHTVQWEVLQRQKEAATQAVHRLERYSYSDWKWFNYATTERAVMLSEDERRLIESGADAPRSVLVVSESAEDVRMVPESARDVQMVSERAQDV